MQTCTRCQRSFDEAEFYPSETNRGKRRKHCPSCFRDARMLRIYGITPGTFKAILVEQGGCAVCGGTKELCVDHDHRTLEIRGILCTKCNTSAGSLNDDPARADRLAAYLRGSKRYGEIPRQTDRLTGAALATASSDIIQGYKEGASLKQLMELHGLSYHAIRNRLLKAGVTLRPKGGQWRT